MIKIRVDMVSGINKRTVIPLAKQKSIRPKTRFIVISSKQVLTIAYV
jgi:hypothetical protein